MVYYRETQTFDRWVYWLVFGSAAPTFILYLFVPSSSWGIITLTVVLPMLLLVGGASSLMLLNTEVTDKDLHGALGIGRGLLHKRVPLANIARWEVVTYNALDYGGWGFKGWAGKSTINARGDRGVLLHLTGGEQVIVGSQEPERLARALAEAKRD